MFALAYESHTATHFAYSIADKSRSWRREARRANPRRSQRGRARALWSRIGRTL